MLTSITPLGERGKGNRWGTTATAYVAGSALGGAALGLLGGGLGTLVARTVSDRLALVVLAVACLVAAALDLAGRRLPSWHRQVDEQWLQAFRGWVYGAGFGTQLGFGLVTIITSASTYVVVLATVLAGSVPAGLVIGATFGLARGLVLLAAHTVQRPEDLSRFHERMARSAPLAGTVTVTTLVVAGVLAGVLSTTWGVGV